MHALELWLSLHPWVWHALIYPVCTSLVTAIFNRDLATGAWKKALDFLAATGFDSPAAKDATVALLTKAEAKVEDDTKP